MMIIKLLLMSIFDLIHMIIQAYIWVIIIGALLSWVNPDPYNKFVQIIYRLTLPVYNFVRRYIRTSFGMVDLAPLLILLALQFLDRFIRIGAYYVMQI